MKLCRLYQNHLYSRIYAQQPIHMAGAFCPTAASLQETHVVQRAYNQSRWAELENEADELKLELLKYHNFCGKIFDICMGLHITH